jgi:uncharacterized protein YecE (DUF72 family)
MVYLGTSGFSYDDWVGHFYSVLGKWLPKIQKLGGVTEKTFIFTNNHWRGQSIGTIRQLRMMLD